MIREFITGPLVLGSLCLIVGCATERSGSNSIASGTAPVAASGHAGGFASKYKTDDGRVIEIGHSTAADGGLSFKEPHLDKCWLADGFTFTGYDTLYIAPTASTAKVHDDEVGPQKFAMERLPLELQMMISRHGLFPNVVVRESDIKPENKTLRLETTITEYTKGGGGARYWAGLYGAGQPALRVVGKMTDQGKPVFTFEGRRSGVSAGARMIGGFQRDEDIQSGDIHSLVLDLTDFMAAVAGRYEPK